MVFLQPLLLWGLVFGAVPIIIHLLFRQRYRKVEWAPMKYLKLALKRTRRRIQIEQLLLLMVRVTAAMLLFFLVSRPVLQAQGMGLWLTSRARTSHLLVLDDSLSMGMLQGGKSAFDRARDVVQEILQRVGPQDRLTVVLTSQPRDPLLREVEVLEREEVTRLLARRGVTETYSAWNTILESLDEMVTSSTYPLREVAIVTDLRQAGWEVDAADLGERWSRERVRLRIFDVGSDRLENVALNGFEQVDRVALAGVPTRWEAVIANRTGRVIEGQDAVLSIDGKPANVRLPTLEANAVTRVPIATTLVKPGLHRVSLALPGDDLPGDDQRWATPFVRPQLRLLLVDGEPSAEAFAGELDFLALAYSLGVEQAEAWQVESLLESEWMTAAQTAPPDLLVLANVPALTPEQADLLHKLVAEGCGLILFPGDQVDPENYNRLLFRDGQGLLPTKLGTVVDEDVQGIALEPLTPSPLESMSQLRPEVLQRVRLRKFYQVSAPPATDRSTRVVARWNNPDGSPAALEKSLGKGRVLLWTVSADREWSDWPTEPSYVLGMRESVKAVVRGDDTNRQLTAGDILRRPISTRDSALDPVIEVPGGESPIALTLETTPPPRSGAQDNKTGSAMMSKNQTVDPIAQTSDNAPKALTYRATVKGGVYSLTWKNARQEVQNDLRAVNPNPRESDLARLAPTSLQEKFGTLTPDVIAAVRAETEKIEVRGKEIWRALALALLCIFAIEAGLATWVGRQH